MRNGYLRFFAVTTEPDNDAENQSLLCAEIMPKPLTMGISHTVYQGETFAVGNMHTKIIVLHTTRHCFCFYMLQIDFKCILH